MTRAEFLSRMTTREAKGVVLVDPAYTTGKALKEE